MKHIFVLAMDELQRRELGTIRNPEQYTFHGVLDQETLVEAETIDFDDLLDQARRSVKEAGTPVDAIIAHWDFPTSILAPILCKEFGVPSPSLESVLKCEHKYWSRLEQAKVVPEVVPGFACFDPFDDQALEGIHLDFPFWIKPIKAFSSQLGFLIENREQFLEAQAILREKIGRLGMAFDQALARVGLPEELGGAGGCSCLAEELISGMQVAPEGAVCQSRFHIHGIFDMNRGGNGTRLDRLEYPSQVPRTLQRQMEEICEKLLAHIGFDNGCFNVEFMWDEEQDRLRLIEVNTRMSQSHSEIFILVDGMSNHEVAVEVALGHYEGLPQQQGPYRVAAKFILTHPENGRVRRIPTDEEIEALRERFPHMRIKLDVEEGMTLDQVPNQDAYNYTLGELYLGAEDHESLLERYRECVEALNFDIIPLSDRDQNSAGGNDEHRRDVSLQDKDDRKPVHTDA
ncbi:MAG: ATP-grasp domain-containing protein [Marinobacter sp.]